LDIEQANYLIRTLSETRSTEVKRWFDPTKPEGKAKLVKGCQALRNYDGGCLVIGFDDETMQPDLDHAPPDVSSTFHADVVQATISHYSSEPFDVEVYYPEMGGRPYVVIAVPQGILSPVAVKRDLFNSTERALLTTNDLYFRTLQSNNRVSSAKITHGDLPELVRLCFNNREADIGSFVRRHLSSFSADNFGALAALLGQSSTTGPNLEDEIKALLDEGDRRYEQRVGERGLTMPRHGTMEVALILSGTVPHHTNDKKFLRLLDTSNPDLTGWPIWLNSEAFDDRNSRPYVMDGGWEALLADLEGVFMSKYIDFMRKEPSGRFYLRRGLRDDLSIDGEQPLPNTVLDFGLVVLRVAETIAVGRAFARAMGCPEDDTTLEFGFRWRGMKGRTLSSWANSNRHLSMPRTSVQDEILCRVSVPLIGAPETTIDYTYAVVSPLFSLFDGFEIAQSVVADLVTRLLERRLQ
jgi:hypothetical protein